MINQFVIASNNSAKTREIVAVFATLGMTAVNYRELMPEKTFPAETTDDQFENALVKARFIQQFLPHVSKKKDTPLLFQTFLGVFLKVLRLLKLLKWVVMLPVDGFLAN